MTRTWKRIILITAVLLFAVGCAYGADRLAYQQFSSYDAETDVLNVFMDGSEAYNLHSCEITDGSMKVTGEDPYFYIDTFDHSFSQVHFLFKEPLSQTTVIQVFYAPGGYISQALSVLEFIADGSTEYTFSVPEESYTLLRLDIEQDVNIRTIYVSNEERIVLEDKPNAVRIVMFFSIFFFPLCALILLKTRKKAASSPDSKVKRKPLWVILFCNLFLSLTVLFFQPMIPFLTDIRNSAFPVWNIWWIQLLVSIGIVAVLSPLMLLLPPKAGRAAAALSLSLGAAYLAQALLFNDGKPFAMTYLWPIKIGNIFAWFGLILITVVTTLYYQGEYGKRYDIIFAAIACLLIAIQAVNFTMLATSEDKLARSPDYLGEKKYQQYIQPGNPDLIRLEESILNVSMYRGMPYIIKDKFCMDVEDVYDAVYGER